VTNVTLPHSRADVLFHSEAAASSPTTKTAVFGIGERIVISFLKNTLSDFYDGSPPQGLSEARRGKDLFSIFSIRFLIRRGGAPPGAAAFVIF